MPSNECSQFKRASKAHSGMLFVEYICVCFVVLPTPSLPPCLLKLSDSDLATLPLACNFSIPLFFSPSAPAKM